VDPAEYRAETESVVASILPRLSEDDQETIQWLMTGYELPRVIRHLTGAITTDNVPVTQSEATRLNDILAYLGEPTIQPTITTDP